jgi:phage tail sheath gpL-like
MRVVAVLAVAASVALIVALLTNSAWAAGGVIAMAVAGIGVLLRDWRGERGRAVADRLQSAIAAQSVASAPETPLAPDDFFPDLSPDPDGPSSDARAD